MAHTRRPPSLRHKLGEKLKPPGSMPPRSPSATKSTRLVIKSTSSDIKDNSPDGSSSCSGSGSKSNSPLRRLRLCVGNVWRARRRIYFMLGIAMALYIWFKTRSLFSKSVASSDGAPRSFLRQAPKKEATEEEEAWKQLVEAQPEHEHVNNASQLNHENVEQPS